MQQQRSVGAGVKECCGGWFSVGADFGLCALDNVFCGAFCAGYFRWKDSNLGRTELDLGLVCSIHRGLQPEVCCVVLYYSLLVLLRQGCWSEDRNLSFCTGKMQNEFSAKCDDFGQCYVWIDTVLLTGEVMLI